MSNTIIGVVGVMTVVASILVKLIGLPDQVRKNRSRKSTEGLSVPFFITSLTAYSLWTLYGFLQKDWVIVLGQGAGVLITAMVVYQIWHYRGRN